MHLALICRFWARAGAGPPARSLEVPSYRLHHKFGRKMSNNIAAERTGIPLHLGGVTHSTGRTGRAGVSPRSCGVRGSAAKSCIRNATTGDPGGFRPGKWRGRANSYR